MVGVRLNPWTQVIMAVFVLTGACVSGFPYGACGFRSWADPVGIAGNCDFVCTPNQYYKEADSACIDCPTADHLTVYGSALLFPVGEDSCEQQAYCVQAEDRCHFCEPVPYSKLAGDFDRCRCRPGFSVVRIPAIGLYFFVCQRNCSEENGGCMQRCEEAEAANPVECHCADGYTEEEDGEICKDIDECQTGENTCRLPNTCVNKDPGYTCDCKTGFMSSLDGRACTRANGLVCIISILDVKAPFELDPKDEDFGELTDPDAESFDKSRIESMFQEVLAGTGSYPRGVTVKTTFVNGHLEFQVTIPFVPEIEVEEETAILAALSERLSRSGYNTVLGGNSFYISRPVYCYSKTTGGIPLPIDAPCEWYNMAGYCLQESRCGQDGGRAYCDCYNGWYGKRCEFGTITPVDIALIVLVILLFIMFVSLCCYVCCMWRRRRCSSCGRSSCNGRDCSSKTVYAKNTHNHVTHVQPPFAAPVMYQQAGIGGSYLTR